MVAVVRGLRENGGPDHGDPTQDILAMNDDLSDFVLLVEGKRLVSGPELLIAVGKSVPELLIAVEEKRLDNVPESVEGKRLECVPERVLVVFVEGKMFVFGKAEGK